MIRAPGSECKGGPRCGTLVRKRRRRRWRFRVSAVPTNEMGANAAP